jgi:ribosomal protein L32
MAVPKKKVSPRRRGNRRFSFANQLKPVSYVKGEDGQPVRAHRVSSVEEYNRQYAEKNKGSSAAAEK